MGGKPGRGEYLTIRSPVTRIPRNRAMHRIGNISPPGPYYTGSGGNPRVAGNAPAARFAKTKTDWAMQVAADKSLPATALRIALVWPHWLNSKTLLAWPAQATIAKMINCSPRTVRTALKQLETRNHLRCVTEKRGGRKTNRYRIVLHDIVICEQDLPSPKIETGTSSPVRPERGVLSERRNDSSQGGSDKPVTADACFRGTLEETLDKSGSEVSRSVEPEKERGPPATAEAAAEIMRDVYGPCRVDESGHLL
jgi:hypothetical protein